MTKYVKVDWPESQKFSEYKECYIAIPNDREDYTPIGNIYMVPEDLYNKLTFPETYKNKLDALAKVKEEYSRANEYTITKSE